MQYKAHAKVNIFLKIVGTRGVYHELLSRFVRVSSMYDLLSFVPKRVHDPFELQGAFDCSLENNTIYKAYLALKQHGFSEAIDTVMHTYALHVNKAIPTGAGLGGGSSDAATFLKMLNDTANLGLTKEALMRIGATVGADVPFFVSDVCSANVSGIGEMVDVYEEESLPIEVMTPPIACNTAKVYHAYRENFLQTIDIKMAQHMLDCSSEHLLTTFSKEALNDLYAPALKCYPELNAYAQEGWFFSGSGSSFFRVMEQR